MSIKTPQCWATDPHAHGLRVEISAEHSLLLPHDEFVFAELQRDGKAQTLRLVFATHEVLVRGHSLHRIEAAMQRLELSSLAVLPANHRSLVPDGQPVILEVVVTEIKDTETVTSSGPQ